ncbi:uncharacterized protein [Triticum aestivum]|uniref:uncharacterized protein n=1 Tax=Triticum aestivum TaxID=4565 RepID=UPI000844D279|nr:uncharacterized protein LOC123088206 [Triticum aestivum]
MALPDELLEEIFLRLAAAADLTRASAACVSFRRVITGHPFLRRFRTLHAPPLLGILCGGLIPAQPPHPSAAAAAAFADADLSCSFLPPSRDGRAWRHRDGRDGRALFSPALEGIGGDYNPSHLATEFAVCDPLHRRYLLLPALPDLLVGQVHRPDIVECEPFLAPPGPDDVGADWSSFRVMYLVRCTTKLVLFVFSTCAGQWLANPVTVDVFRCGAAMHRFYAHGCFCWEVFRSDKLLVLDARRIEFSTIDLPTPPGPDVRKMAIVEAGGGRLGMLTISKHPEPGADPGADHLLYAVQSKDANATNQWQSKLSSLSGFVRLVIKSSLVTCMPISHRPCPHQLFELDLSREYADGKDSQA